MLKIINDTTAKKSRSMMVVMVIWRALMVVIILALLRRNRFEAGALLEPVSGRVAKITNVPGWRWNWLETGQALLLMASILWIHLGLELGALLDPVTRDTTQATNIITRRHSIRLVSRRRTGRWKSLVVLYIAPRLTRIFARLEKITVLEPMSRDIA